MPIPFALLARAKDLLVFDPTDTGYDWTIESKWDEQVDKLAREHDLFVQVTTITLTAKKSIYQVPLNTTRILSVLYNGETLQFADRRALDLKDPDWEIALPGVPQYWSFNAVPGELDTPPVAITPRQFLLYPAPDGESSLAPLTLISQYRPTTKFPAWMDPIFLYMTVGQIAAENPNLMQPEKGEWFQKLAEYWMEQVRKLMQV